MGLGLSGTGNGALGLAAVTRGHLAAKASGLCAVLGCVSALLLAGCSSVGGITGAVAGIASGSAVANPAVGVAIGIGVQAGVDASIKTALRYWSHEEQTRIASLVGAMEVGQRQPWEVRHTVPYGNEQGEVAVVRAFATSLAICKEAIFSVEDAEAKKAGLPQPHFVTTVCQGAAGWKWSTAEPAVAAAFDPSRGCHAFQMIATDYLECLFADHLVQHMSSQFPGVSMSVRHPVHPTEFNKVLESGQVDFAVGILPFDLDELRHRLLFRDHIVCMARAGHRAVGRTLSPADFAALGHVAIMPNTINSFGDSVDEALGIHGPRRNRRFVTPNYMTALHLLECSDMVALLPHSLAARFRDRFSLAEIPLPVLVPEFEIAIAWHERTHRQPAHIWFRDQVVRSLRSEGHGAGLPGESVHDAATVLLGMRVEPANAAQIASTA